MPHRLALAKDDASNELIKAVTANAPAPGSNIMIGDQSLADMMAQAQAQAAQYQAGMGQAGMTPGAVGGPTPAARADPIDRLSKLADLHDRGVLTDEEFEAQKAKILES
jgi:hypothetical protein